MPHLSFRDKIYYYPYINDAEYLVFLVSKYTYPLNREMFNQRMKEHETSKEWEIIEKTKDVLLLKRKKAIPLNPTD